MDNKKEQNFMLCIVGLGHKSPSPTVHLLQQHCMSQWVEPVCSYLIAHWSQTWHHPEIHKHPTINLSTYQPINPSSPVGSCRPQPLAPSLQNTARDLWEVPVETFREVLRQPQPGHGWGKEMIDKNMSIPTKKHSETEQWDPIDDVNCSKFISV